MTGAAGLPIAPANVVPVFAVRGFSFVSKGPVKAGYIELGDVTVLIGPNDAGKTRILRLVESALTEPFGGAGDEVMDLFGFASKEELDAFVDAEFPDEERIGREIQSIEHMRSDLDYALYDAMIPIVVRLPVRWGKRLPTCHHGRPAIELSDELQEQLSAVRGGEARDEYEPPKIFFLGGADSAILPLAVAVPARPEAVEAEAADAVEHLCAALRLLGDAWSLAAPLAGELDGGPDAGWTPSDESLNDSSPHASARWLLNEEVEATSIHPAALQACEALERMISRLLPDFISDTYTLEVRLRSPVEIARGEAITLQMAPRESSSREPGNAGRFPIRDAASGFTVWLQLAIREAAARITNLARLLMSSGTNVGDPAVRAAASLDGKEEAREELEQLKQTIERALAALENPEEAPVDSAIAVGFKPVAPRAGEVITDTDEWSIFRPRLYLIDEPEQRLHPALQRRAAQWLVNLMGVWGSQCILATHSFAFMDLPGRVRAYELVRSDGVAALEMFDIGSFTPHAQLARAIGLDRGELLSRWRAFLFVEGLADLAVIEELFAERLATTRIRVIAVHGHRHHAGLLDMTLLADELTAPIAAMFDSISDDAIAQLRRSGARERAKAMEQPGEAGTVARIVDLELKHERSIEIFTIGVPDIFDLLEEQVIRDLSRPTEASPIFPGHESARSAFASASRRKNAAAYKKFLADTYGVSTNATAIRRIARAMHDRGFPPPTKIDDVLASVERLAITAETSR